jgi:hypothetical protein
VTNSLPYQDAASGDRALAELQRILEKFGCTQFGTAVDNDRQVITVAFRWRERQVVMDASWKGYAVAYLKRNPWNSYRKTSRAQYEAKALLMGRAAVCSVLRDWVKGQTTALECGVLQFEEIFMPFMRLPDGRRVLEAARDANLLPQLGYDA